MNTQVSQVTDLPFTSLSPRFGAELGPDIRLLDLDDNGIEALQQLAAERGVLVVRDQVMTPDEQVGFARRLGDLFETPMNRGKLPAELIVIHADENSKHVAGSQWHSDVSSEAVPPGLSMLRLEVVPEAGGDTIFADMTQMFDSLSEPMQAFLLGLHARHDPKGHYLYVSGAKRLDELPSSVHPVIRTHPRTGRPSLYVNAGFTGRIVELSPVESDTLLKMLYDHVVYSVEAQIRIHWQPNTVVFWDNRVVQHRASWDYFPALRHGYRATIIGEAPYLEGSTTVTQS
jgi:taurine dioxygenase